MISCNLQGGLGNQMFQIAAAHALALRNKTTSSFNLDSCHTPAQGNQASKYRDNILSRVKHSSINNQMWIYNEPKFSYNEIPNTKEINLNGFFQSEKYFSDYKEEIKDLFGISEETKETDYLMNFRKGNLPITSIHVRRGDYLQKPDFHPVCSVEYYKQAMDEIGESNFMFVSDDMEWVMENFKGDNIWYSDYMDEVNDFKLMVCCDNNIISNSSFSWWGAYLNKSPNKRVIAPNKWFGPKGPQDTQDIIPSDWSIINA